MENEKLTIKRTTFEVDGTKEKCVIVSNGNGIEVRISKMYYYLKPHGLYLCEFIDGEYNNSEEWIGNFDELNDNEAIAMAKKFSVYL